MVGAARSGTTLMRNLLERSDRIALARENHYMGHLFGFRGARQIFASLGDPASDETLREIVNMIYSGGLQGRSRMREVSLFWRWLAENVSRDEMERRLLALPADQRNERGLFVAFLRAYADVMNRPIIGEKTPAHLSHVDTLMSWFPTGKVVHMVRDPRAVYVSDERRRRGKPRKPFSWFAHVPLLFSAAVMFQTIVVWRGVARRHRRYAQRYPQNYRMVRFEDLVRDPGKVLADLFDFLGVEMPDDPTDVSVYARGFSAGEKGIDAAAADRWRTLINPTAERVLKAFLRGPMRELGYNS